MKLLIVDDSVVYRSQIRAALTDASWIEVVGVASNGKIALEMLDQKEVDVMTLDMEMPVMDGLSTLKELRRKPRRTKVIVFSSATRAGSTATFEALSNGADDFIAKPSADKAGEATPLDRIRSELLPKILQFKSRDPVQNTQPAATRPTVHSFTLKDIETFRPEVVVIASSTGGPAVHDRLFRGLGGKLRCPVLIAQHMPPVFTSEFAKRIKEYSGLECKEAENGEPLRPCIYVAPGDFHMGLQKAAGGAVSLTLDKGPLRNSVRPAADVLFETGAAIFGHKCMGFVLTGMGEDGLTGARSVKTAGGGVMIQDEKSCVVFGMPGAVFAAKAYDAMGSVEDIRRVLARMVLQ